MNIEHDLLEYKVSHQENIQLSFHLYIPNKFYYVITFSLVSFSEILTLMLSAGVVLIKFFKKLGSTTSPKYANNHV